MRLLTIAGILLLALGAYILVRGMTYTSERSLIGVGKFQAAIEEKRSVPPWVGGLAVAAGVSFIFLGARRRK